MTSENTSGDIPKILTMLETKQDRRILPESFDRKNKKVTGQIEDYNVSGDHPVRSYSWDIVTGKCEDGNQQHDLKENDALRLAARILVI